MAVRALPLPRNCRRILSGNLPLESHPWAVKQTTRFNDGLIALTPTLLLLILPVLFNLTETSTAMYTWLNNNYSPYQINVYWGFAITSITYNIGGLIFMLLDFYAPTSIMNKWKLQPEKAIDWTAYKKIWLIVFRNQVSLLHSLDVHRPID